MGGDIFSGQKQILVHNFWYYTILRGQHFLRGAYFVGVKVLEVKHIWGSKIVWLNLRANNLGATFFRVNNVGVSYFILFHF